MKTQRLPKDWAEEKIRKLAEYHDNLTEDQQAAEIEAALTNAHQTVMVVQTARGDVDLSQLRDR